MIRVLGRDTVTIELQNPETVGSIMKANGLSDERYICIRGGQPLTSDEIISPDDDVQVLEIFSGGM
ncbi:MAG: hypothetical protein AAE983_04185 [Thermoplasmataceae archaeon]|jgi:sulfur carrier protein ThiS